MTSDNALEAEHISLFFRSARWKAMPRDSFGKTLCFETKINVFVNPAGLHLLLPGIIVEVYEVQKIVHKGTLEP